MARAKPGQSFAFVLRDEDETVDDHIENASDELVDAIVAWGSLDTIAARVKAHLAAGADHVCVQVLPRDQGDLPLQQWRELATIIPSL